MSLERTIEQWKYSQTQWITHWHGITIQKTICNSVGFSFRLAKTKYKKSMLFKLYKTHYAISI